MSFSNTGDADNAIEEYRTALQLNPNNIEAHLKMGFLLYNVKGMFKEGMAHLSEAIRLDPDNPRVHHDLGMALLHQRKLETRPSPISRRLYGVCHTASASSTTP